MFKEIATSNRKNIFKHRLTDLNTYIRNESNLPRYVVTVIYFEMFIPSKTVLICLFTYI